jgi:hypothetical protein
MTQQHPGPGFYRDPAGGPARRWFNGTSWTDHYAPPSQPSRITIHYGFALLAILSLMATLFFGIPMMVAAGHQSETDPDGSGAAAVFALLWMGWGGMWTLIWTAFAVNHTLKARRGY